MTDPRDDGTDDLSAAERRALAALAREESPSPDLEERTVALLRRTGHLPTPITVASRHVARSPGWRWMGVGIAAAVMLFASGIAVGQYLGMRNATLIATSSRNAAEVADRLDRSGTRYIEALASLQQLPASANAEDRQRAKETALRVLGAAAEQISHVAPDDPLAAAVLRGLNERGRTKGPDAPSRSVIWY
jgi:hypothetical protein